MNITLSIISLLLCFLLAEGGLRLHYSVIAEQAIHPTNEDSDTDWRPVTILKSSQKVKFIGKSPVTYQSNKDGFRAYPESIDPDKPKLLIIGDSYTQALEVNQDETYYHHLNEKFNVYAIGAGGWGSLQEYLTLVKYFDRIRPDIVILQFCSNDIINNSFSLTRMDHHNHTDYNRRFLIDGRMVDHRSVSMAFNFYKAFSWSRFIQFMGNKYLKIKAAQNPQTLEEKIEDQILPGNLLEKEGVHTAQILQKVVELVGHEKLKIFNVSKPGVLREKYDEIISNLKIESLDAAVLEVHKEKDVFAEDGAHFNSKGHKLLADGILSMLYPP